MSSTKSQKECTHAGCNCQAEQGGNYCSPYCETTQLDSICGCGHEECSAVGKQTAKMS